MYGIHSEYLPGSPSNFRKSENMPSKTTVVRLQSFALRRHISRRHPGPRAGIHCPHQPGSPSIDRNNFDPGRNARRERDGLPGGNGKRIPDQARDDRGVCGVTWVPTTITAIVGHVPEHLPAMSTGYTTEPGNDAYKRAWRGALSATSSGVDETLIILCRFRACQPEQPVAVFGIGEA